MNAIEKLTQIDYLLLVLGFFAILFACKEIIEIFSYFKKKFRVKFGSEEDKEGIEKRVETLEKHDNWQYKELTKISDCVEKINKNIVEKEIDDIRWEILDFTSALSDGRKYNKEAFNHIFKLYDKYEKILKENNMENGLVEESMKFIREMYNEKLKKES